MTLSVLETNPLSAAEIASIEERIGFSLPADHREFLATNGGGRFYGGIRVHVGSGLSQFESGEFYGKRIEFFENTQLVLDRCSDGLIEDAALVDPTWGDFLVPFAGRGSNLWYCFDFSFDSPPVVRFDSNGRWARARSFTGIEYVADTFLEFLGRCVLEPSSEEISAGHEPYSSATQQKWDQRLHSWLGV